MARTYDPESVGANPAERLLELFRNAEVQITNPSGTSIKGAWSLLLSADNDALLLRRLGLVYAMPLEIREHVHALPNEDPDLHLRHIPKVEQALQRNLHEPWAHFKQHIDEAVVHSLEVISHVLDREKVEGSVAWSRTQDLLSQILELRDEVEVADINEDLRAFLLRQLKRMERAIDEVSLLGAVALTDSAQAVVGALVIRRQVEGAPTDEKEASLFEKVGKVAATALTFLNLMAAPFNVAIAAQNALDSGADPIVVSVVNDEAVTTDEPPSGPTGASARAGDDDAT